MNLNKLDWSVWLTSIGDMAFYEAKMYNIAIDHLCCSDISDRNITRLKTIREVVEKMKGFSIQWDMHKKHITRIYITYYGEQIGLPWVIDYESD